MHIYMHKNMNTYTNKTITHTYIHVDRARGKLGQEKRKKDDNTPAATHFNTLQPTATHYIHV